MEVIATDFIRLYSAESSSGGGGSGLEEDSSANKVDEEPDAASFACFLNASEDFSRIWNATMQT